MLRHILLIVTNFTSHQSICGFQVLHYNLYFLKQYQIVVCKLKTVPVCINSMHHVASMAKCDNVTGPGITNNLITLNHNPKRLKFVLPCLVV